MQRAILLFGYPGSGKGTQGRILSVLPGFHHVAMGDILRALTPANPLYEQVQSYLRAGNLVPDELVMDLFARYVETLKPAPDDFLIIDGVPRNARQVELLNQIVRRDPHLQAVGLRREPGHRSHAQARPRPGPAGRPVGRGHPAPAGLYRAETESCIRTYPGTILTRIHANQPIFDVHFDIIHALAKMRDIHFK